ncbi:uncharacterized protein LOC111871586 [Cryptotermes secundus]|uniref:uncharacterized protein LOC111871586 n=1 Tax=Cryptotermes secundus TaxID=105785 RepID=UPI000CD7AA9C|nr:uncharacterized protein LOC111871586 [Cryptotermes secundus]
MGTLTRTVWLLLAFTALASNFDDGAAYVPPRTVLKSRYLCGFRDDDRQGPRFKTDLPIDQKSILTKIMNYLSKDFFASVMGDFTFKGQRIPIDFIMTTIEIDSRFIQDLRVEDLWGIIQLYGYYEKMAKTEPRTRDISKYEHITALFMRSCSLSRGTTWGKVYMDGALVYLGRAYSSRAEIKTEKTSQIVKAIKRIAKGIKPFLKQKPVPEQPTKGQINELQITVDFLKTQSSNATGSFLFLGHRISIQFIEWYLVQNGKSVKNLTAKELFGIITSYLSETEEFNGMPEKEKAVLRDILNYLKFLGDGARGEVTFKSHTLSIDFIMTVVHLQGADIYSLTLSDLWQLIKMYEVYEKKLGSRAQNRNIKKYEQVTLLYAITYLRNDGGVTGQIVIDGVKIQVSYILNQLKIRGKDFRTVNIEQIHGIIHAYKWKWTPHKRVPLGTQPTEEQTLELRALIDLMKTQRSPAVGSFIFSGYRTSVQFILSYMDQHGLSIDKLSSKELWSIMLLHERNETNTSVSVRPESRATAARTKN